MASDHGSDAALRANRGEGSAEHSEQDLLRILFDAMPQLGWTAQPDGYIDYYNRGWYEFTGTTYEQTKGWGWESVHHPDHLARVLDSWKQAIGTGQTFELEFPLRRKDGAYRWFLTRATPVITHAGKVVRWVGINTDIDDQKRAEQTLVGLRRAAEEDRDRIERMFHEVPAAICVLRGECLKLELLNPVILKLWGKDISIVGKPLMEAVPELRGQGFDDLLRGVLRTGTAYHGKETLARLDTNRDGVLQNFFLDFVYVPLRNLGGATDGVFVHAYDVTDKVIARSEAERLRDEAERATHSREQLLAIVSHDLRNPLGTVLLGAKRIERIADDSDVGVRIKKTTNTILTAVDQMSGLVGSLLDMAKLEAGHSLALELESVDIAVLARQAAELFESLAGARQLTLKTDTVTAQALCDSERVQQVLSNLIGNAIKFTPEGGEINVHVRRTNGEVVISIGDTGIGIGDDLLPHLFEPYWQGDGQRKGGAGLGLSIAKAIVDAHGGRIWVETTVGQGSTFYFALPAVDELPALKDER